MDITDHQKTIIRDILNAETISSSDGYPVYTISNFAKGYDVNKIEKIYGYSFLYGDMWKNQYLTKSRLVSVVWENQTKKEITQTDFMRMYIFVDRPNNRKWFKTEKKWIVDLLNYAPDEAKLRSEPYTLIYENIIQKKFDGNFNDLRIDSDMELGCYSEELGKNCDFDKTCSIYLGYGFRENCFLRGKSHTPKTHISYNKDELDVRVIVFEDESDDNSDDSDGSDESDDNSDGSDSDITELNMAKNIYNLINNTNLSYIEIEYYQGTIYYGKFSNGFFTCLLDTNSYQPSIKIDTFKTRSAAWNNLGEFKECVTKYYLEKINRCKIVSYHSNLNKKLGFEW